MLKEASGGECVGTDCRGTAVPADGSMMLAEASSGECVGTDEADSCGLLDLLDGIQQLQACSQLNTE